MTTPTWRATTHVEADFSQFYVRLGGGDPGFGGETSLASFFEPADGDLLLTAAVHHGSLPVTVNVHGSRPDALGADWRDVVELSVRAADGVRVSGWEPTAEDLVVPLRPEEFYRFRYAIDDMSLTWGAASPSGSEQRYLVEFWPEEPSPSAVVTQETAAGRYWRIVSGLDAARADIADRGDPSATSEARVIAFADRVFDRFPDLLTQVVADPESEHMSMVSVAATLWRVDWSSYPRDYEEQRALSDETRSQVAALIVAKAMSRS